MGKLSKLKDLFSLLFEKPDLTKEEIKPPELVPFLSVKDPVKRGLFEESLRSHGVHFEVRNEKDIFVPRDELDTARAIIEEGDWEY